MPQVTVIGAGIAGLAAALRLLERGFHVTLLEQDDFLGGKLGAHRHVGPDFHEHSYHMYLNWYHNFWSIIDDIGARGHFMAQPSIGYLRRGGGGWRGRFGRNTDVASPETVYDNIMSGLRSPADMFLYCYFLLDLTATPVWRHADLDRMSVRSFMSTRGYMSTAAMDVQEDGSLKAFACPNFLTAARSFRRFIRFSQACPSPMMWLLRGNTRERLFGPLEQHLRRIAADTGGPGRLEIRRLHRVTRLRVSDAGTIDGLDGDVFNTSPSVSRARAPHQKAFHMSVVGDVILAVPPESVSRLVDQDVFRRAPGLASVRYLHGQAMMSVDLYFNRHLDLPEEVVSLLGSRFALSFLNTSRLWTEDPTGPTFINVVASDCQTIQGYDSNTIADLIIHELMQYLPFTKDEIDHRRVYLQTNTSEPLFTNEVGSWEHRPATTCDIPNLFMAGDYCQNPIDVVTIEGAVVSGLLAAEAVRARANIGTPIKITHPATTPEWRLACLKLAGQPYAYAAYGISTAQHWWRRSYREMFPNG